MLQLKNQTPFVAQIMLLTDRSGIDTLFTVIKATFVIGDALRLANEQLPITLADEFRAEPATSSIRAPSDVSIGKLGTDVVVNGSAWAPGGTPAWQMDVSVAIGPLSKHARVFADRVWDTSAGVATASWLTPFERMPLVWERAYGGSDATPKGPTTEARNPVGAGFRASDGTKPLVGLPLPNVEDPASLISSWKDAPVPTGFGAVASHWLPRRMYAGTYDDAWMKNRAPYLPADFDLRFCQVASSDLIAPTFLEGGELVALRGMTPTGLLQFTLPCLRISVDHRLDNANHVRPATMDTVVIEPDSSRLSMVWRATFPCDKKVRRIREVTPRLLSGEARAA